MVDRVVLHSDANNFYASCEECYNPELKKIPFVVGGDVEKRHGIVLAKNGLAKKFGIQTAEAVWQAMQKCPNLKSVSPNYERYLDFSTKLKDIYSRYTDQIESFGLDEAWLDITGSLRCFKKSGLQIAEEINQTVKRELGITVSIGVSWNKVFAKLGSDYKKPDAITQITRENYRDIVWKLPASDLLYVGRATALKFKKVGVNTIGDIANADPKYLKTMLGVYGLQFWEWANGCDNSQVSAVDGFVSFNTQVSHVKSIGNSTTCPRDLTTNEDVKMTIYILAESVAERLRENNLKCKTIQVYLRDKELYSFERQGGLHYATCTSETIANKAYDLFLNNYNLSRQKPLRSIGVRGCNLLENEYTQVSILDDLAKENRQESLETAIDQIRHRFGHYAIQRGVMLTDTKLSHLNPKGENTLTPEAYLKT